MPFISNGIYDSGPKESFVAASYPSINFIKTSDLLWSNIAYEYYYICSQNSYNIRFPTIFAYGNRLIFPGLFNESGKLLWYDYNMDTDSYTERQLNVTYSYKSSKYNYYYAAIPMYQISGLKWFVAIAYVTCSGTTYCPKIYKCAIINYENNTVTELNYTATNSEVYGYNSRYASNDGIFLDVLYSSHRATKLTFTSNTVTTTVLWSGYGVSTWVFKKNDAYYWLNPTTTDYHLSFSVYDSSGARLYESSIINGMTSCRDTISDIIHIKDGLGMMYTTSSYGTGTTMYLSVADIKDIDLSAENTIIDFKHNIGSLQTTFSNNGLLYDISTTNTRPIIIDRSQSETLKIYLHQALSISGDNDSKHAILVQYTLQED